MVFLRVIFAWIVLYLYKQALICVVTESGGGDGENELVCVQWKHNWRRGGVPNEFKTKGGQSSGCVVIKPERELGVYRAPNEQHFYLHFVFFFFTFHF